MTELSVQVKLTPKQVAEAWWSFYSDEQAEFFEHLHSISKGKLELQTCYIRDECEKRGGGALDAAMAFAGVIYRYGLLDEPVEGWMVAGVDEAKRELAKMGEAAKAKFV